ncbi:hypothetical protein RvY_15268 [Ramazzottius varieornatus]|uniref:Uncharacterized protein n=1 Tax=Ramazzottius varieornatus TaxID=947166 RepID=A0A1D1VZ27_RAMVA|nr:hypothetical protein RvY_15268 [Ramazzottius varieornatus]
MATGQAELAGLNKAFSAKFDFSLARFKAEQVYPFVVLGNAPPPRPYLVRCHASHKSTSEPRQIRCGRAARKLFSPV